MKIVYVIRIEVKYDIEKKNNVNIYAIAKNKKKAIEIAKEIFADYRRDPTYECYKNNFNDLIKHIDKSKIIDNNTTYRDMIATTDKVEINLAIEEKYLV